MNCFHKYQLKQNYQGFYYDLITKRLELSVAFFKHWPTDYIGHSYMSLSVPITVKSELIHNIVHGFLDAIQ